MSAQGDSLAAVVLEELLDRLRFLRCDPALALELGAGVSAAASALARSYPRSTVMALDVAAGIAIKKAVTAAAAVPATAMPAVALRRMLRRLLGTGAARLPIAAQRLLALPPTRVSAAAADWPLATASVDLVFSSLALQWCEDLEQVLAEARRVLRPGGLLLFSIFGRDTLAELRAAWAAADEPHRVNHFPDVHEIGSLLARRGYAEPVLDVDRFTRHYADVGALGHELASNGWRNVGRDRALGLTGRRRWQTMLRVYEQQRVQGQLPVSCEVIYGCAWVPLNAKSSTVSDRSEATIKVSDIGRRRR